MSTIETTNLLSVAETAQVLRVSRATAYRLIERGELPAIRIGGSLRIDADKLNALLGRPPAHDPIDPEGQPCVQIPAEIARAA